MSTRPAWPVPRPHAEVDAVVRVPGSKSLTNRWLVLAALADGPCTVRHALRSQDTERMLDALIALGLTVDTSDESAWVLTPPTQLGADATAAIHIDCGQAGTVMRFVPPLAALTPRGTSVVFDGHPSARTRPVGPVLTGLADLGIEVDADALERGTLPYTITGTGSVAGGEVGVDASASSQFVSALLLSAPRFQAGLTLRHTGDRLPSVPHIDMTVQVLRRVGVEAHSPSPGVWRVEPGAVRAFDIVVEPDLSSAAPFLALAATSGGMVRIPDWPASTTQPGDRLRDILATMGVRSRLEGSDLVVHGNPGGHLQGADLDLSEVGELTPVVAALATLAHGPSRLRGVAHLRGHETDRLAALAAEISRLGGSARELADGLEIEPRPLTGATLSTYHDHRMAMFAAVIGSAVSGVSIEDIDTAAKTFPGFDRAWQDAVGGA